VPFPFRSLRDQPKLAVAYTRFMSGVHIPWAFAQFPSERPAAKIVAGACAVPRAFSISLSLGALVGWNQLFELGKDCRNDWAGFLLMKSRKDIERKFKELFVIS
jgi:hypothetical protein